jgi:hypothetical protein
MDTQALRNDLHHIGALIVCKSGVLVLLREGYSCMFKSHPNNTNIGSEGIL